MFCLKRNGTCYCTQMKIWPGGPTISRVDCIFPSPRVVPFAVWHHHNAVCLQLLANLFNTWWAFINYLFVNNFFLAIGRSKGVPGTPPRGPNSFIFMQFSAEKWELARPSEKSWICHCLHLNRFRNIFFSW